MARMSCGGVFGRDEIKCFEILMVAGVLFGEGDVWAGVDRKIGDL